MASIDPMKAAAAMAAAAAAVASSSASLSSAESESTSSNYPKSLPEFLFGGSNCNSSSRSAVVAALSKSAAGGIMDFSSPEAYPFNLLQLQQQTAHQQAQQQAHFLSQQAAALSNVSGVGSSSGGGVGGGKVKAPKKSRSGGRSFMCYVCQHEFDHVSTLLVHMSTSHFHDQIWSKYETTYFPHNFALCVVCNRDFKSGKTKTNCVGHIGGKHRKVFEFMPENESNALQYHTTRKPYNVYTRQVNKDDLVCMYCNKQLSTLTVLKQHIISSHLYSKMNKEYGHVSSKCPFCEKTFSNQHDKGGIMMHIGAKHNKILDFVPQEIASQLQRLNVKDELQSSSSNAGNAVSTTPNSLYHNAGGGSSNAKSPEQAPHHAHHMNPFLGLISSSWQQM